MLPTENSTTLATNSVDTVRAFNRFYTRRIGVLQEGLSQTQFTLTEARLLWEFAHRSSATAADLSRELGLDAGYLSRLLGRLKQQGLIRAARSKEDARRFDLRITAAGRQAFDPLDSRSQAEASALLHTLTESEQHDLMQSMHTVRQLLSTEHRTSAEIRLRPPQSGDIGWVISRHGALYAREYGWDMRFEALVARIAADFIERFDAEREACWIAERDGARLGAVFLVQARDEQTHQPIRDCAQLRMLLVEPAARGAGLGGRLVAECERFARARNYQRIVLWTNSLLLAARGIYRRSGYRLTKSEPHHSFGHDMVGESWELQLS
jgi:DNA-binding MarR family transcriptional regulator/GNAT superfamily N-acetyltransferase